MNSLTLTPQDVEAFAESGRHALGLFLGQYALIAPKLPSVTPEALDAMMTDIVANAEATAKKPQLDQAVFLAALIQLGLLNLDGAINRVRQDADATALHSLFQQTYATANGINALTLLSRGGLMPELHLQELAPIIMAQRNAEKRHAATNAAKYWVQKQWKSKGALEYDNNKSEFARRYVDLVPLEFPGVTVTWKVLKDRWLP